MAKILAVDDEPAILEMIESILNKDGHLVTKVSNPLKINMEELHRYDLILLDIMMPGIDGFELCKRIRALVDCPILFLTAKTEENSLVNGLSLGADDYISMIQEATAIMNFNGTTENLVDIIHTHPTLEEILHDAAL